MNYDPEKVAVAFQRLFRTYPSFQAGAADDALRVYFEAVESYQTQDIETAVANFLAGNAPGVTNFAFAPPAPLFAAECRRVMNLRLDSERRSKRPLALPEPSISEAERARVAEGFKMLLAELDPAGTPDEAKRESEHQAYWAKVNARFAPDQSDDAMRRRLHLEIGDPEGDREVA